jgi:MSHA pilin protein MshD
MCTRHNQRGISLIELIMFIVIVSVALAGILLVMNVTTKSSADPLIHKQSLAIAESLLEEIELQDFIAASGVPAAVTQAIRASQYHIVSNYNGFPNDATTGIFSVNGAAITGLENYNARVTVAGAPLGTGAAMIAAGSAVLVTVTVIDPQNNPIEISGYRTAY